MSTITNAEISIIYTTVASMDDAEKLANSAVEGKYAACVNIIPKAVSIYEWEGKIERYQEYLMLFKTSTKNVDKLYDWIQSNHPYSVPAILKANVSTSDSFYQFILKTTS
jgi:periplasmic divalent cation tolerance protein